MSRLRARTWTPLERRVMKAWKFWNGFVVPIEALVADGEVLHQARGIFVDAERIMRTKGVDPLRAIWRANETPDLVDPLSGMHWRELSDILDAHPKDALRWVIRHGRRASFEMLRECRTSGRQRKIYRRKTRRICGPEEDDA